MSLNFSMIDHTGIDLIAVTRIVRTRDDGDGPFDEVDG